MDIKKLSIFIIVVIIFVIIFLVSLMLFSTIKKYPIFTNIILSLVMGLLFSSIIALIYLKKWDLLSSSIIFALVTVSISSYIFPLIFIPKTEIDVSCNKDDDNSLRFEFNNVADFAGDDFNIDIMGKDIMLPVYFEPWVGKLCNSSLLIANKNSQETIGIRIKCDYIPPRTPISFNMNSNSPKESYIAKYYSKTTKFTVKNITCE